MGAFVVMLWIIGVGATYDGARPWLPKAPTWAFFLAWPVLLVAAWICVLVTALDDPE